MTCELSKQACLSKKGKRVESSGVDGSGLSIILMLISGALAAIIGVIYVTRRLNPQRMRNDHTTHAPSAAKQHELVNVRYAAVVKAAQLREIGYGPAAAARLFSEASSRWAGANELWLDKAAQMKIDPIDRAPEDDDWDVIVTFSVQMPATAIPSNRLDMRECLSQAEQQKELEFEGLYDCPLALDPRHFGFEVG